MGYEKYILYNNAELKRPWGEQNEPLLNTPKAGILPKKVMMYRVGLEGSSLL